MPKYTILAHNTSTFVSEFYDCDTLSESKSVLVDLKRMYFDNHFASISDGLSFTLNNHLPIQNITLKTLKTQDALLYVSDDEIEIIVSYNKGES